jgi:hypothetical protein
MHGRRWGKKFVRELAQFLASEETFTVPIRPHAGDEQAARVHHETMALFQGHLPAYLALIGL